MSGSTATLWHFNESKEWWVHLLVGDEIDRVLHSADVGGHFVFNLDL